MKSHVYVLIALVLMMFTGSNAWSDEVAPGARRLVSSPTALTTEPRFTSAVQLHTFFGVAYTVGGSVGYVTPVGEKLSLGVVSNFGVMLSPAADEIPLFYGAGPALTYGDDDFLFSMSTLIYGGQVGNDRTWLILPSIGMSKKINDWFRIQGEVVVPVLQEKEFDSVQGGAFMYGMRFGKKVFADVNFIAPFGGDTADVYEIFPLGFPIFAVGSTF